MVVNVKVIYIYKTVWPCVRTLSAVCLSYASDMSCPTGPRNGWRLFVDQIVDPGIIEITLLHKENQTLPLKNHT